MKNLVLNKKRILIIGFAFFGILMLWQVYNTYCPVMLTELLKVKMSSSTEEEVQWVVGIIMAADNIMALFMLPLFGYLSDKTVSRFGKRMPYIVVGTIFASIALPLIPLLYAKNSLVGLIMMMGLVLLFMNMYRNPAVSLMPDITPKPLRSKANAIINLVGYVGAILAGAIALVITTKSYVKADGAHYLGWQLYVPFLIASVLMIVTMVIMFIKIKENKIIEEVKEDMKLGEELSETADKISEDNNTLSKKNLKDLILLIVAVFLWFAAFNAIETFWSSYCTYFINFEKYSLATVVLTFVSLFSFIPAGMLSDKIGRKYTIIIGLALMVIALIICFLISPAVKSAEPLPAIKGFLFYALFGICGVGWAFINCCSYPMVVEFSNQKNVGKFTGLYYSSSMLAQSITPVCIGLIFGATSWRAMFPYSTFLMIAALIVFLFISNVKINKVKNKKGLEALDQD